MNGIPTAFTKYHGNGNDFIIFDLVNVPNARLYQTIIDKTKALCDRHHGIGGDGVITLRKRDGQWRMTLMNADASVAKNCGNGLRVAAHYLSKAHESHEPIEIKFAGHEYRCTIIGDEVCVAMGTCLLDAPFEAELLGAKALCVRGHVGNDHIVFLVDDGIVVGDKEVDHIKKHFSDACDRNIGFLWRDHTGAYKSRVYERGVGWTQSCCTGAIVAAAFLMRLASDHETSIVIHQPGGALKISVMLLSVVDDVASYNIVQQGNAEEAFRGICQV